MKKYYIETPNEKRLVNGKFMVLVYVLFHKYGGYTNIHKATDYELKK